MQRETRSIIAGMFITILIVLALFCLLSPERKPVQSGILPLLKSWLVFFEKSIIKQLSHKLIVAERRLHVLEGLLLIFANIDEVIRIIRHEDDPSLCS